MAKTEKEKTHFRKAFNSPYLSSADIVEPTVLTIKHVMLQGDHTKKSQDHFNTAHFVEKEIRAGEPLKPMILNATNSRIMKALTGSPFIDDWCDVQVTIYVDHNVKNRGEIVDGLRISSEKPRTVLPTLTPDSPRWEAAVAAVKREKGNTDCITDKVKITAANLKKLKAAADVA